MDTSNKEKNDACDDIEIARVSSGAMNGLLLAVVAVLVGLLQFGDTFNENNRTKTLYTPIEIEYVHIYHKRRYNDPIGSDEMLGKFRARRRDHGSSTNEIQKRSRLGCCAQC